LGKEKASQEIAKDQGHTQFLKDHPQPDKNCDKDCKTVHQHNWQKAPFCEKECKTAHQHNWDQKFCEKECKISHQHHFATDVSHNRVEEHEHMDKNIKGSLDAEKKVKEEQFKNQKEQEEQQRKEIEKEMEKQKLKEEAQREMNLHYSKKAGHEPNKIAGYTEAAIGSVAETLGYLVGDAKMEEKGKIRKAEGYAEVSASQVQDQAKITSHKVAGCVTGHVNQTQPLTQDK